MISKLYPKSLNRKYCTICVLTVGLTYVVINSCKIQKYVSYVLNKWILRKRNTYVVSTSLETKHIVEALRSQIRKKPIVGLDCEWVSTRGRRHPVALLQIAAPGGLCSLFRLCSLRHIPEDLANLLEDKNILKVGVAVVADARNLLADYGIYCQGLLDLRHLAGHVGVEPRGLAFLAKHLFEIELDKDWRVRCSDWEAEELSEKQIEYAAQDACIAIDIFEVLNHKRICKTYSIWRRMFWSQHEYWQHSHRLWAPYIGQNFKDGSRGFSSSNPPSARRVKPINNVTKRDFCTLQKQHYSNIFLLAPDDQVLSTISESRAAWYIQKQLVDVVCDEPKTLKLRFEPAGRSTDPDNYYARPKNNRCVVCGFESNLVRKNVVPLDYRKHFDGELKNHHSHDVLLLCITCHFRCDVQDNALRNQLVEECEAPLAEGKNSKLVEVPNLKALRSASRALYFNGDVIPKQRIAELQAVICDKLGISSDQLTSEYLENLINIECLVESERYIPHGLKVVQHYKNGAGVEELERRWRQNFLDTMSPQFMPDLWSVNYVRE